MTILIQTNQTWEKKRTSKRELNKRKIIGFTMRKYLRSCHKCTAPTKRSTKIEKTFITYLNQRREKLRQERGLSIKLEIMMPWI